MATKNKIAPVTQVTETNIDKLASMAVESAGRGLANADIAKYIISVSPYYRKLGYNEIMELLKK